MTTIAEKQSTCGVCGEVGDYVVVTSTNQFGSSDLDTRPAEMMRSTMQWWIECCPACGYCTEDVSAVSESAAEVVRLDAYQQQRNSTDYPELSNGFLCYSMLQERVGNFSGAGWSCVNAAWAADDAGMDAAARDCRVRAVSLFRQATEHGQRYAEQPGAEEALLVDLLRRAGEFDSALETCNQGLDRTPEDVIVHVLRFQRGLIEQRNIGIYTVDDVMEETER